MTTEAAAVNLLKFRTQPVAKAYVYESFGTLMRFARQYLPAAQLNEIKRAYMVATVAHHNQHRKSGSAYITHPTAVASMLAEMQLDHETIIAGLLHDILEDTVLSFKDLQVFFGLPVAKLVQGLSKLAHLSRKDARERQADNFRKMILATVEDIRVLIIKLVDRTHNIQTLGSLPTEKARRIARETLEIYAPLAYRLSMNHLKLALEEHAFARLYPRRYRILKDRVELICGHRKPSSETIMTELTQRLSEYRIEAQVTGRTKNIYTIYQKMRLKRARFHAIMDIMGFRIIVNDLSACYLALGMLHSLYPPKHGHFKDYIALPKRNGYQSLHTAVLGPYGQVLEVQIRTKDMDNIANLGITAHWVYKEGLLFSTATQTRAKKWTDTLLELQQNTITSSEFLDSIKADLLLDEIYVFTPEGKIIALPEGSTAVDLAYAIHTDLGNTCTGARVDHRPYPLKTPLRTAQTVSILTSPGATPSPMWLNFTTTAKARSQIRYALRLLPPETAVRLGKSLLEADLGHPLSQIPRIKLEKILQSFKLESAERLCRELGFGNLLSASVSNRLHSSADCGRKAAPKNRKQPILRSEAGLVSLANCCHPIPQDKIIALMSPEKGLVVHRSLCHNLWGYKKTPEKLMPVQWDPTYAQELLVDIEVTLNNHSTALPKLTSLLYQQGAMLYQLLLKERAGRICALKLTITTKNRDHLATLFRALKALPEVKRIIRAQH